MEDRRALLLKLLASVRERSASSTAPADEEIAVIGLAGRFPKARNPDELWDNVVRGRDCVTEVPADRWDGDAHFHPEGEGGLSYSKWAGWLDDVDCFDPLLFQISPSDAEEMDPQERLFLEMAWACAEDAGYRPRSLSAANPVGVFAGVMNNDYEWLAGHTAAFGAYSNARSAHWSIANRVSYVLDLRGPSLTVDTACSASLTAIHLACESLRRGECQTAIAGGVNLILHPMHLRMLADRQMISHGDQCRSFGAGADGFVDGEGVGAVLLKPLRAAEADGDRVYAVLKGSAVNAGGKTSGYTVPNPSAQAEVIRQAMRRAGVEPGTITYVEAHGTATPLGDPIEIAGLREAFGGSDGTCAIGSLKSNIGHLESAAGIAALTKVLMQLRHGTLAPSLHSARMNPDIDLSGTPFRLQQRSEPWRRPLVTGPDGTSTAGPRRAGISSFGGGGANAHLIVEEYSDRRVGVPTSSRPELIVLSALTEERLRVYAGQLADFLERRPVGGVSLDELVDATARVLRVQPHDVDPEQPLEEHGLGAAELVALGDQLGLATTPSAQTSLRSLAGGEQGPAVSVADVAHTLRVGREQLDVRLAFVASEVSEVCRVLRQVQAGERTTAEVNDTSRTRRLLDGDADDRLVLALADGDLGTAARLWTQGARARWSDNGARRIGLPTYPFARGRYWMPPAPSEQPRRPHVLARSGQSVGQEHQVLGYYQPVWCPEELAARPSVATDGRVAVLTIGEPDSFARALLNHHPGARLIRLDRDDPATAFGEPIEHLYHLGGMHRPVTNDTAPYDSLFALMRAHPPLGRLTVVTSGAHTDNPQAAAILGFVQVMAAECPGLDITCVDVTETPTAEALAAVLAEPADPAGRAVLLRAGRRHVRRLLAAPLAAPRRSPYREGGTYLVVGGTGGIGRALSEDLARSHRANLVWISRGELAEAHRDTLERIREAGGQVLHLRADVADPAALRTAVAQAKQRFGVVNGVFHAAMEFHVSALAQLTEPELRAATAAKIDGSLALVEAVGDEPLDFMAFFSSVGSFVSAAGNAAYVAASAFQDAYGRLLSTRRGYPVRVINWGYWGSVGSGAQPGLRQVFDNSGITAFSVREGLDALERVLAGGLVQVMPIRATERALEALGYRPSALARRIDRPAPPDHGAEAVLVGYDRLAALCDAALLGVYQRMGVFRRPGERHAVAGLADRLGIVDKYRRLHAALLNALADAGYVALVDGHVEALAVDDQTDDRHRDDELDRIAADHPDIAATVTLTRLFLRDYPRVLRGEIVATEIMFPGASMDLVQDFYRGNPLTDSFNDLVAGAVSEYTRQAVPVLGAGRPLRVVEFGAGTGATTERVLPRLERYADRIEYVFTDVSAEFLANAERRFAARHPFLRFHTLDLERDLSGQGFAPGSADVVVATNVVHATRDLRVTLGRARDLLRPGGWLVLNELTALRSSITVTGGVLDGWWAFGDGDLRIRDAPLAEAGTWQRLLAEEGFADVCVLDRGAGLGQHVIIAETAGRAATISAPVVATPTPARERRTSTAEELPLLARLARIVETTLKLDTRLDPDRPLAEYGFDSLSGMRVTSVLEEELAIRVPLADVLAQSTLRDLATHIGERTASSSPRGGREPWEPPTPQPGPEREPVRFPLSVGQRALGVIERTAPGNYAYNLPLAFWLEPGTDLGLLRSALQSMTDRHPQLRARVTGEEQVIAPHQDIAFEVEQLATSDVTEAREAALARAREPFDLAEGPLLRVSVFQLADGRQVLLLTFHHIVFDGVSIPVFLRELSAFYRQSPPAGPPPALFEDFVRWQRELLASERGEQLRGYWLRQLAGDLPTFALPLDRPRPVVPSYRGASIEGHLTSRQVEVARALARDEATSLFCVLLATYVSVLRQLTRRDRVLVGTPVAGRPSPRYADVLGYFMNMVVLKHDPEPGQSFRVLLRQVRDTVLSALEHSDYPLLCLAQDLRVPRLFDTAFYFQNWVEDAADTAPVAEVFPGVHQEGEFDLTLEVVEQSAGARYCLKYNPDLFDEDTVRRAGEWFAALLDEALAEPDRTLEQLCQRTGREAQPVPEVNAGASADPVLPELLAERARRTPDAVAVLDRGAALTYRALVDRVTALALRLRRRGVGPGRNVGVLFDRSADMLVALLGVLAAGGAYVPLDPDYPLERLRYMATDAGLCLLVTNIAAPPDLDAPVLGYDASGDGEASGQPATASPAPTPDDPAYVIYTSGSTGRPKGVRVPHRALSNLLLSMAREPGISAADHLLALTTVCFDIAALELFGPLVAGGTVEIVPTGVTRDGVLLRRLLESSQATIVQATPATWRMLLAAGWRGDPGLKVLCGGEALDQDTAGELLARAEQVWNMFGPTETTIWSAVCRLRPGERVTIGRPIARTQLHVLDPRRRPVPAGVPGELYIGGAGLALGYLGRPELTAERFVTVNGERLYRTGDLVEELADGRIAYLGRLDAQVKVRGFRIEPGEVEAVLRAQPGVCEAAVVARRAARDNVLYAFVVLAEAAHPPEREALGGSLPAHMLPDAVVALPSLPRTLNGKIDRVRLADAPLDELRAARPAEPPAGAATPRSGGRSTAEVVEELATMIAEILGIDASLVRDDAPLGELGLNSVSFTALSTRITQRYGIEVLPTVFYRFPTLSAVAAHLAGTDERDLPVDADRRDPTDVPATDGWARPAEAPRMDGPAPAAPVSRDSPADVAIIGMAARLPGSADLAEFWDNLEQARDLVGEIPADRWDWRRLAERSRSRWGGFLSDVDRFDAAFFAISPREAELMDPQQRLLLEVVWSAIEDAGYRASDLAGRRVGVFVGVTNSDYAAVQAAAGRDAEAHTLTGAALSIIPNRISYMLDLRGPSVAVDTACSSSLTAVHQAVSALRDGSCDLAIAGGVSLILDPRLYTALSGNEMLSEDGRCKAFDAAANGYVRGEGVGVVVLRPHTVARQSGDRIAAVIKATAVNHGGRTTSLTSPNPNAQTELLLDAYRSSGIDPSTVGYVEAHGTGTALGDPIEIGALSAAFAELRGDDHGAAPRCGIGSVKTNIGHLEAAAGIAGLLKVVLSLRHRTLPASLHFHEPNPYLELEDSPFEVIDSTRPWQACVDADGTVLPRRAGVSSFGFGGANAHIVLEEAAPAEVSPDDGREQLFVLSARTERALSEQARRLAAFVRDRRPSPADVAYTLRVGREPMRHRLAFVARGRDELVARLEDCAEGRFGGEVLRGQAERGPRGRAASRGAAWRRFVTSLSTEADLLTLAELWTDGVDVDLSALPAAHRIGLPTYPFERTRHWVDDAAPKQDSTSLLDENVSTFSTAAFVKRLTGSEFYLADHVVGEDLVLPAVVYLEMARAAGERAHGAAKVRRLDDVVWAAPVVLRHGEHHEVRVRVAPTGEFDIESDHPHASGRVVFDLDAEAATEPPERVDLAAVRGRCARTRSREQCYEYFASLGFHYGPGFRAIAELALADGEALARLHRPDVGAHRFHPSLLDGALQAAGCLVSGGTAHLPYSIGSVRLISELPETCYAHATLVERRDDAHVLDIVLTDEHGVVVARIDRFVLRAVARPGGTVHAFEPMWREVAAHSEGVAPTGVSALAILKTGDGRANALREHLQRLAPDLPVRVGEPGDASHLVHLAARGGLDEALRSGFHTALNLCRARIADHGRPLRYLYLHDDAADSAGAAHAAMQGFARCVSQEHPDINMTVLAHPGSVSTPDAALARLVLAELGGDEPEVRSDEGRRLVRGWRPLVLPRGGPSPFAHDGAHIVTGGSGRLGLLVADRIARHPGARVVLVSRSRPTAELPSDWLHLSADVSSREDVERVVREARDRCGRVAGVVHAAGTLRDSLLLRKSADDADAVIAPKVRGLVLLDEATRNDDLDYFVAFGSTAAVLGNVGQSDYAFANSFLDHYMARRAGCGLTVDWSLWRDGGMAVPETALTAMRRELGMEPLASGEALDALEAALASGARRVLLTAGERERIADVLNRPTGGAAMPRSSTSAVSARPPTPAGDLRSLTERYLRDLLAEQLKMPVDDVVVDEPFERYGIDSLLVLSLTRALEKHLGPLSKTLFFEYLTVGELAGFLVEHHSEALQALLGRQQPVEQPHEATPTVVAATSTATTVVSSVIEPSPTDDEIVIVGVAGRYPRADDLWQYWRNLREGRDCVQEVPGDRWDHDRYYDPDREAAGKTYARWGGFLGDVDSFDPMFFRMSKVEAQHIDPQERIFLETVWHLLEDAGTSRAALAGTRTGVFVGLMYGHYQLYGVEEALRGTGAATSSSYASVANRVSYFFDFDGPSVALDTMCSSSLTALHLACQAIREGDCDVAVAGGVNITSHPVKYLQLAKGGFLSSDGRCRSFGEGGDGYVPAEGAGAVLLKRRSAAEANGDRILAVIRATAVNHGGAGKGFSVPNPRAHGVVIGDALTRAGITPAELDYLEAHGTGTALGDPVEIAGLMRAFGDHQLDGVRIPIGSVKSNIGHAESAAGIAAITKVLLQLRHRELAPSLHAERLNPHLDLAATPFRLQRELGPWPARVDATGRELPRVAGISAFGAGGSNAHVILSEYVSSPDRAATTPPPHVFVLSARDEERLTELTVRMAEFLRTEGADVPPAALAATLHTREPMARRLAVVFDDVEDLLGELDRHLAGASSSRVLTGTATRSAEPAAERTPRALAEAWVRGARVTWPAGGPRVSLPGYPFARESCRLPVADALRAPESAAATTAPPTGDLRGEAVLCTDTPVIAGHRVRDRALFPALAYLDLVAGVFRDHGYRVEDLEFRDLTALRPLDVTDGPVTVEILCAATATGRWQVTVSDDTPYARLEVLTARNSVLADRLTDLPSAGWRPLEEIYRRDDANGQQYSGAARAEGRLWTDEERLVAELTAPSDGYLLHPALLLGGAVAAGSLLDTGGQAFLPLHAASFRAAGPLVSACVARVRRSSVSRRGELVRLSVDFFDSSGRQVAELSELSSKAVGPAPGAPSSAEAVTTAQQLLRRLLAARLDRGAASIPLDAGYYELGVSSVQVLDLVGELGQVLGRELAPTLPFERTTIRALAAHLAEHYPDSLGRVAQSLGDEGRAARDAVVGSPSLAQQHVARDAPPAGDRPGLLDGLGRVRASVTIPSVTALPELSADELDLLIADRVLARLRAGGAFSAGPAASLSELADRLSVLDKYRRWLREAARLLADTGLARLRGDVLELTEREPKPDDWVATRRRFASDPYWNAQLSLVEECVERLPDILSGAVPATEVLFPGGSLAKLSGVYQGNAVADRLNAVVAEVTVAAVRDRLVEDPSAVVRVAEVGAGTGGTTAVVLPDLDIHAQRVEYWFTDLSPAFLEQAKRRFGADRAYLRYGRWNVEQPGAGEKLVGGGCDVIVATNVLHATRDVRLVLRNLAQALRPGGVLVVNEITRKSAVLTLTFGLLDGWWRYDDEDVRVPGAPILDGDGWQRVLDETGYAPIWRPVAEPDSFGEVFVARRPVPVEPPAGVRLLAPTWEPATVSRDRAPEAVAVLGAGPAARRLADALPDARLVESVADLVDRYEALVDLGGVGLDTWLPMVQRMIGRGASLLGVGQDDARAGLYRMLGSEYARVRSRYLVADIDDPDLPMLVTSELSDAGDDAEVRYQDGVRHRAVLADLPVGAGAPIRFPADEVLLITGGTGGVGLALARHAVERWGARTLVLTGRGQLPPREEWDHHGTDTPLGRKLRGLRDLERDGVRLGALSLPFGPDSADTVAEAVSRIRSEYGPIGGVLHAAGLVDRDNLAFVSKPAAAVRAVLAPKTSGLDALVEAVAADPVRLFVLFSSVASLVPAAAVGQGDYAMANAHMDAVARRGPHGLPLVSVAWPRWTGTGMGTERPGPGYQATGLGELTEAQALDVLDHVLSTGVGPVVLPAIVSPGWSPDALRRANHQVTSEPRAASPAGAVTTTGRSGGAAAKKAEAWLLDLLAEQVGFDRDRLCVDVPIADYGTDSIMMVQLLRQVGARLGAELDPTVLVEQPTVEGFVGWLAEHHGAALAAAFGARPDGMVDTARDASGEVRGPRPADERIASAPPADVIAVPDVSAFAIREGASDRAPFDVAIVGMSGRFPGAGDLDAYWRLLREGRCAISRVPAWRWGRDTGYHAGLIDLDGFDPGYFHLSDSDAAAMDPQALLLLEETLFALADAGYEPSELRGREVGVYVGGRTRHDPGERALAFSRNPVVAIGQNYLAANLSHYFDLCGPSMVVDTACSSSLVAMHHAVQALRAGDVEAAVVAGVGLLPDDGGHRLFDQRGVLNPGSEFHVFDRRARGFTPAEGVGVLLLKPLAAAEADGDRVRAVIKAVAVNNDGRTAGPATPNPAAQARVMATALTRAGVKPDDVAYIETNAAGSALPDLIELKAIHSVYRDGSDTPCCLGSVKPNIGHPQCAEGIAGVIKTVLMLGHRAIVPFRSGQQPLEHFDLASTPLRFERALTPWPDAPLVAAVSSFADGGTNAHVILAGWSGTPKRQPLERPTLRRRRLPSTTGERFAIIGMAGHYPGAPDLAAFWENLRGGRDTVTEVPADRWSASADGRVSRWGGFLDDVDLFDAEFFRISRPEAEITDPQERWFLRTCWEAIEDAGYTPDTLATAADSRHPVGVFVGTMHKDYTLVAAEASGEVPLSLNQGQIANRVSFVCDFHGPSMTVDTLCSSSLTALHLAVQSLRRGECEVAIAGGVNLSLHPGKYVTYGMVGMHSSDGRCRSFGEGGDGYVSAEGAGALILKPLGAAEADGDHIYAVVAGSALNHVGSSSGFSVPSPVGQAAVIRAALADAGVDARSIGYVEAHGTGTSLGDPIEVRGLTSAFAADTDDTGFCALGSVKSNIGHAESAAGVAALTKAVLQLHHRTLVPTLHAETVNPLLHLDSSPFRLQRALAPWPGSGEQPRRAGVSSFGATGANAHVVLEEYVPARPAAAEPEGPVLVPLSARSQDRLRAAAARLRDFLAAGAGGASPRDIAYTLQVGRVEWPVRVAFVVRDIKELIRQLDEFVASGVQPATPESGLGESARNWTRGDPVDWSAWHGQDRPRRVSLPSYPFGGERYWVPGTTGDVTVGASSATPVNVGRHSPPRAAVPPAGLMTVPRWVEAPDAGSPRPVVCRVLVVSQPAGLELARALADHYRRGGAEVVESPADGPFELPGQAPDRVHLVAGADAERDHELTLLRLVRALDRGDTAEPTDLFIVTQDTQSVAGERTAWRGAGLTGLAYFLARDGGRFAVRNLDVSAADLTAAASRERLAAAVAAEPPAHGGELIALRGGRRYRQEVRPVDQAEVVDAELPGIRQGGTYVVVGGSGTVGRLVGRYLVEHHNARVVCVGRRPESDPAVRAALLGGRIGYVRADVTERDQARRAIAAVKAEFGAIHGVVFAGATPITGEPRAVATLDEDEFRAHFDVKSIGGRNVYEAVAHEPLDFVCYFSSAQAFSFGGAGTHAAYAAGITSADAFARAVGRDSRFPVGVINWGAWRASFGEAARDYPTLGFLEDHEGTACFETAVRLLRGGRHRQVVCMRAPASRPASERPVRTVPDRPAAGSPSGDDERRRALRALLVERLAATLRVPTADLSPSVAFFDLGVDSITGSAFVTQIGEELGLDLNPALLYDFSSVERLADHLIELTASEPAEPEQVAEEPAPSNGGRPVLPEDLVGALEARFTAGELTAAEVLALFDAELAVREQR